LFHEIKEMNVLGNGFVLLVARQGDKLVLTGDCDDGIRDIHIQQYGAMAKQKKPGQNVLARCMRTRWA